MIGCGEGIEIERVTMTARCKCGASITLTGGPERVQVEIARWGEEHQGEGHGPCGKSECLKARKARRRET